MSEENQQRCHAYLSGRVQGVGFRFFTLRAAQDLGLTGWVRNLWDGRVEVVAEGELQALNSFLGELRKGPISAGVDDVEVEFSEAQGEFSSFKVLSTA